MIRRKSLRPSLPKPVRGDEVSGASPDRPRAARSTKINPAARKALRRIDRLLAQGQANDAITTKWENDFLSDVKTRIECYGRAFSDPEKGDLNAPVSVGQGTKLRQIQGSIKRHYSRAQSATDSTTEAPNARIHKFVR